MSGNELNYVSDCIKTSWISSAGAYLERFESEWAKYCGQKYGVGVCNGTAALELAVKVCDFPEGSEIILPSFTIISCAQAVVKNGCVPVLVDCDPVTYCMDVTQIESKLTDRTVAIMPVHIYGHPCNMDPILDIAERHRLIIIEDAAEVHGGEYLSERSGCFSPTSHPEERSDERSHEIPQPFGLRDDQSEKTTENSPTGHLSKGQWKRCGSFGHLACFSFYANKIITTGEGGMVLTSDDRFLERLRKFRNLCFLKSPRFLHHDIGSNFRMTNIQAAIGVAQLEDIEKTLERKIDMANKYSEGLKGLPLKLPTTLHWAKNVVWMYSTVLCEEERSRLFFEKDWISMKVDDYLKWPAYKIMRKLETQGIQTRSFFIGIHEQPVFHKLGYFKGESYPVTEEISRSGFYLPSGQAITDLQIDKVCSELKGLFS